MAPLFYSTGQVARQLGTTLAAVRALCENRVIAAETSPGGHWRVPASEVERLKREGLPPIPRPLPNPSAPPPQSGTSHDQDYNEVSDEPDEVAVAAAQVAISKSTLERRKVEREIEENEDWFRDRRRRETEAAAVERQKTKVKQAARRREEWIARWIQHAIRAIPFGAQGEMEPEVHRAVQETLSTLDPGQSEAITWRLVEAAMKKTMAPWHRKQDIERALTAAMNKLPFDVQHRSEYGLMKRRAWNAAVAAVDKVRAEANFEEMCSATTQAVQPMIQEYEHQHACERMAGNVWLFDLTSAEQDRARDAVRKALAALPVGSDSKRLESTKDAALAPYRAGIAKQKQEARLESERQERRRTAAGKADSYLGHISTYLAREFDFDGKYGELLRETNRLKPLIREALIEELVESPNMTADEIRESIEDQIEVEDED